MAASPDAIVIGAGPNGLSAAIALARAGRKVIVFEAMGSVGGGASSAQLTLPGFVHDVYSAVHPFAVASPFWRTLPLGEFGLEWVQPPAPVAHPLDREPAAIAWRSIAETAASLGSDGETYREMIGPVVRDWGLLEATVLGPPRVPRHPLALAKFGMKALRPASSFHGRFDSERAPALMSGLAAHAMLPLEQFPTGAVALIFAALAHTAGWPFPRGGAQRLADALAGLLRSLGGEIVTGARVKNIDDLPPARAVLCDLSPRPLLRIAGHRFPASYRTRLQQYRYGMGAFKVDWALDAPIPWRDPQVASAGTVHVGGTLAEVAASERDAWNGRASERPFVLLAQPTLFDPTRAPAGRHTAWAYCHVPHGSTTDMLPFIEAQIERFAPGFRDRILARHVTTPADLERRNPNLVGGDIGMGTMDWRQLLLRPTWRQYSTPAPDIFICSASTPPGVGVHGMCGYFAAQAALGTTLA
jgi:phytoene dehydrogenase-like protein